VAVNSYGGICSIGSTVKMVQIKLLFTVLLMLIWSDILLLHLNAHREIPFHLGSVIFASVISVGIFVFLKSYSFCLAELKANYLIILLCNAVLTPTLVLLLPGHIILFANLPIDANEEVRNYSNWISIGVTLVIYTLISDFKGELQNYFLSNSGVKSILRNDVFLTRFPPTKRSDLLGYDIALGIMSLSLLFLFFS